jgi:hypothetical protein
MLCGWLRLIWKAFLAGVRDATPYKIVEGNC